MNLSIIYVNWNSTDLLLESLTSVAETVRDILWEAIVVDNASPSDDADRIATAFPKAKLIKSTCNLGFAGANNLGVTYSSGEYVLFLNPDTKVLGDAIKVLLTHSQTLLGSGVIGAKLLNGDGSIQTSAIQTYPTILNQLLDLESLRLRWPDCRLWRIGALFRPAAGPSRVEAISGACLLMKRVVFDQIGGFSTGYFMYAEDVDLCWRVERAGYVNWFVPSAQVVHYGGQSTNPVWATRAKWSALIQYMKTNRGLPYALAFRGAMSIAAFIRLLTLFAMQRRARRDSAVRKWSAVLHTMIRPGLQPSMAVPVREQADSLSKQGMSL